MTKSGGAFNPNTAPAYVRYDSKEHRLRFSQTFGFDRLVSPIATATYIQSINGLKGAELGYDIKIRVSPNVL